MQIPLNDLTRHNAVCMDRLRAALERVAASGWYILGPEVRAFEQEFAAYCGAAHAVGVANGSDALELALTALGVGAGDRVATVANAGGYSTVAIRAVGARPLYVDVDAHSMCLDAAALAAALTPDTKAVLVTHLYGRLADMSSLLEVAGRAGVPVVEDCAQAHGATAGGRRAGTFGVIGCFSFYPTKNLGALGDGGALVTQDEELDGRLRALRQYGWKPRYHMQLDRGRNSRLDEIQAATLREKLPLLDGWNTRRREIAIAYREGLGGLDGVTLPAVSDAYVAHLYVIQTPRREQVREALTALGIGSDVHYPVLDHQQVALRHEDFTRVSLPCSERLVSEIMTLPCFPELREDEVERVIEGVRRALQA